MVSVAADLNEEIERLFADIQAMEAELSPRAPLTFRVGLDTDHFSVEVFPPCFPMTCHGIWKHRTRSTKPKHAMYPQHALRNGKKLRFADTTARNLSPNINRRARRPLWLRHMVMPHTGCTESEKLWKNIKKNCFTYILVSSLICWLNIVSFSYVS